jgi:polysaccharide biosynthesis transport protein
VSNYADEIDLRPYFLILKKKWRQIALITFICAAGALLYSFSQTKNYEASALVLLTRNKASLSLAEDFLTSNEPIDFRSRMDAMLALGESDSIFTQTIDEIKDAYPENIIDFESFKNSVIISNSGDTIKITVSDPDPEFAAVAANTWAKKFITTINYAYSGEQLPGEIQANLGPARKEYNSAQADLEAFLKENRIDNLQKQISETGNLLDELVQDRTWQVSYYIRRKQKMDQVLNEAVALKEQVKSVNSSAAADMGTAFAILRLYSDAFRDDQVQRNLTSPDNAFVDSISQNQQTVISENRAPDTVYNLQLTDLINNNEANPSYRDDLDRIIDLAEEQKQIAEENFSLLADDSLVLENNKSITATAAKLSDLRSQLEEETARLNDLTSRRDLKMSAYRALAEKETEVRNNLQTSAIVNLVSPAIPPTNPAGRGLVRNSVIGGIIGFVLGIFLVGGTQWLSSFEEPDTDFQKDHT